MVRSGVLSPTEAESHPRRNELLRAIGPRPEVEAETRTFDHQLGDRFLLCTDGLWGPVPEAEVGVVLGYEAPDLAVRKLIGKANERGGPDNVTVQIVWVPDDAGPAPCSAPPRARPRAAARPGSLRWPSRARAALVAVLELVRPRHPCRRAIRQPPARACRRSRRRPLPSRVPLASAEACSAKAAERERGQAKAREGQARASQGCEAAPRTSPQRELPRATAASTRQLVVPLGGQPVAPDQVAPPAPVRDCANRLRDSGQSRWR